MGEEKEDPASSDEDVVKEFGEEEKDKKPLYKPKRGNYQVQVHVIEARDLKGRGVDEMSDPVVSVQCLGKTKYTSIKTSTLNCSWDQVLFFEQLDMDPLRMESEKIRVLVKDANTFRRNVLIGSYEFDMSFVYFRKDHEVYRTWVALTDVTDAHEGIQGYLKLSIVCLGPDDEMKIHTEDEDDDQGMSVLMPPHIEQHGMLMKVRTFDALDMPEMDVTLGKYKCDPYVQIDFGGMKLRNTKRKGQNVTFNEEIHVPVMEPTMSSLIRVSLKDYDVGISNDLISRLLVNYNQAKKGISPRWYNFYGAPEGKEKGYAKKMNEGFVEATFFRGRALLAFGVEADEEPKAKVLPIEALAEKDRPQMTNWTIQLDVYDAIEVPKSGKWKIEVSCGNNYFSTKEMEEKNGTVEWYSSVVDKEGSPNLEFSFPVDTTQVPDLFIYLTRKKFIASTRISYYRIPFQRALEEYPFDCIPKWHTMKEDKALDKLNNSQFPGMVLLGLRVGLSSKVPLTLSAACRPFSKGLILASPDMDDLSSHSVVPPGAVGDLKLTVIKGIELPVGDKYSSDPYCSIRVNDDKFKTSVKRKILNPVWNEWKVFKNVPIGTEVRVRVYDWDFGSSKDLLGEVKILLSSLSNEEPGENFTKEQSFLIGSSSSPNASIVLKFEFSFHIIKDSLEVNEKLLRKPKSMRSRIFAKDRKLQAVSTSFGKPSANQFQLRAHIYQGRQLLGLDRSGLSDPFVVIRCAGVSAQTEYKEQTTNPLYYTSKLLDIQLPLPLDLAPDIVVDVIDKDFVGKNELIGRFFVPIKKVLKMNPDGDLDPQWFDILDVDGIGGNGQILATFELLSIEQSSIPLPVIKPKREKMWLEVSTLGLRGLNCVWGTHKPRVEFELPDGKKFHTKSSRVPSSKNPNFLQVLKIPVRVPLDRRYAPALTLQVRDVLFGGFVKRMIGSASLLLENYMVRDDDERWRGDALKAEDELAKDLERIEQKTKVMEEKDSLEDFDDDVLSKEPKGPMKKESELLKPPLPVNEEKKVDFVVIDIDEEDPAYDSEDEDGVPLLLNVPKETWGDAFAVQWGENLKIDDKPSYMKGRDSIDDELEDQVNIKPFDEITVFTGKRNTKGYRKVGIFKGLIRLCKEENAPGGIDTKDLLAPKDVFVRLYVLKGRGLTPMDPDGASDPYLIVSLGKKKISRRSERLMNTCDPNFYQTFEFPTQIPGPAELKIEVWDWDGIGDDLIGTTSIDVEDRWFCKEWRAMKKKPVEWRTLHNPSSSMPQGKVEMWMDIFEPQSAKMYPLIDISPPALEEFELRVIIWQCKDVTIKDEFTNQNDLYITGRIDAAGMKRQSTDTHLRSKKGFGSFNWRLKFPVKLPMKSPRFSLQIWDLDFFSSNDSICEAYLNLTSLFKKAYHVKDRVKLIKDGKEKFWIKDLRHPNEPGKSQGKVQVSFEIMPKSVAEELPAGKGRSNPNMNPVLPNPVGRISFNLLNPFRLFKDILGDRLYYKMCFALCFILCLATLIFVGPNIIGTLFVKLVFG